MGIPVTEQQNHQSASLYVSRNEAPPAFPQQICRVSSNHVSEANIGKAQQIWDTYFTKMLATFHEPNPNLNRDLALDRTIRALGQRPLKDTERQSLSVHSGWPSAIRYCGSRAKQVFNGRTFHLERKFAQENFFEELCNQAFDA